MEAHVSLGQERSLKHLLLLHRRLLKQCYTLSITVCEAQKKAGD